MEGSKIEKQENRKREGSRLDSPIFEVFSKGADKQYLYICDIKNNLWRWSENAVLYFGLSKEYMENPPEEWVKHIHPADWERVILEYEKVVKKGKKTYSCEYRVRNAERDYILVQCNGAMIYDERGNPDLCSGIITDLGTKGRFDLLTGLCSYLEFQMRLKNLLESKKKKGGILLFGIDGFRRINEFHEYGFGNELLMCYAKRLLRVTPAGCMFYSMEGDKFALIYPDASESKLKAIFSNIALIGTTGLLVENQIVRFTVSGGAVFYPEHGTQAEELYANLEYAFELSKKKFREELIFFTGQSRVEASYIVKLQHGLRRSVQNNCEGFYLCYQPIFTSAENKLFGAEALLRWSDSELGYLEPKEFISYLEQSGDIHTVGKWVLGQAMKQMLQWQKVCPELCLFVNISYIQLEDEQFKYELLEQLDKIQFPKQRLILEVSECWEIFNMQRLKQELSVLQEQGIQIAADNFGAGYASINILKNLTINLMKIDPALTSKIYENSFQRALLESFSILCQRLQVGLCIEGIETEEMRNQVEEYRPLLLQGYYYSRPIEADLFKKMFIDGF